MQKTIISICLLAAASAHAKEDSISVTGSNRVTIETSDGKGKTKVVTVKNGKQTTTVCEKGKCKTENKTAN